MRDTMKFKVDGVYCEREIAYYDRDTVTGLYTPMPALNDDEDTQILSSGEVIIMTGIGP